MLILLSQIRSQATSTTFFGVSVDYLMGRSDFPQGSLDNNDFKFTADIIEFLEKTKNPHIGGQKLSEDQRQIIIEFMKKVVATRLQNENQSDNQES
jgi:hypothetical protein